MSRLFTKHEKQMTNYPIHKEIESGQEVLCKSEIVE